jgi:hypothetical protein
MRTTNIKLELKSIKIRNGRFLYFDNDPKLQGTIIKPPLPIPFGSVQKHNNYKFYAIIKNNEIEKLYATSIDAKQRKISTQIIPTFKKKQKIKAKGVGNVDILIWGVCTDIDRWNANRIISRCHYLPPPNNGYPLFCHAVYLLQHALRLACHKGEGMGLPRSVYLTTNTLSDVLQALRTTHLPFGSSLTAPLACQYSRQLQVFTYVDHSILS